MNTEQHYRIDYTLNGTARMFYLRATAMTERHAWHWATVDAGYAQIPKRGLWGVKPVTREEAASWGIDAVEWRNS